MKAAILILFCLLLISCSTTQSLDMVNIAEGTRLLKHKDFNPHDGVRLHDIEVYEAGDQAKVKVEVTNDKLEITPYDIQGDFTRVKVIAYNNDLGSESNVLKLATKYAYLSTIDPNTLLSLDGQTPRLTIYDDAKKVGHISNVKMAKSFWYSNNNTVFQTLTIPFKIRGAEGDEPSKVSTGVNVGVAFGYQWNLNRVSPIYDENLKKMVGYDQQKLSFSLSPFAGLTTVSLKPGNTNMAIEKDRTVLGFSFGGAGVLTFNRVNLGLALGVDYGLSNSKDWIYQGELWTGIVVGLDIIK